ncbi:MAG: helix-turn-helix domain-containing protein [Propionibacteriaceae bacterium]|jgi:hypothetical protein|nr:helix-turn-helix domain-containing protein [Propionibacteriaceae bacterium]
MGCKDAQIRIRTDYWQRTKQLHPSISLDAPLPPQLAEDRVGKSNIWWSIRDKVPTLPHALKCLVKCRKQYEAGDLERWVESQQSRQRQFRRLSEAQIAEMVEAYRGGQTVYQLAEVFGIARQTVGIILGRQGVVTRRSLAESQRAEIARLREDGWSYVRLGERFGVDPGTVRRFHLQLA